MVAELSLLSGLLANPVLTLVALAVVVSQGLKLLLSGWAEDGFEWRRLLENGGMPSTHSCAVSACAVAVGLIDGWTSGLFAVAAVLATVVCYDAVTSRREVGRHAKLLNQLVGTSGVVHLRERWGHSPAEVVAGISLGVALAFMWLR